MLLEGLEGGDVEASVKIALGVALVATACPVSSARGV